MTVKEAAARLEVKRTTVYALCAAGLLGHERIGLGRGVVRISEEDLAAYRSRVRVEGRERLPKAPGGGDAAKPNPRDPFGGYVFKNFKL